MPVIVSPEDYGRWLDPATPPEDVQRCCAPSRLRRWIVCP